MSEKECSQREGEERLVGEGQCTPGTVEAEHAGRDSVLSRQAVAETEVTVVGRDETTGTDAEVDVGGVSAGPSPVRAGTGLGVRARAETVMTVPSSARVGSEGVCVSPGVGTVAGPSSARVAPPARSGRMIWLGLGQLSSISTASLPSPSVTCVGLVQSLRD